MDNSSPVQWTVQDGIGRIFLNRPASGNAINLPMAVALARATCAAAESDVRAVLLHAEGRHFCVGGDIASFAEAGSGLRALIVRILGELHPAIQTLATLPVPVICAVQGSVAGAGIGLALCCDYVLASTGAKLRGGYTGIGLSPDAGSSFFLVRRAGATRARQILMSNETLPTPECLKLGLFDQTLAPESVLQAGLALARSLGTAPRQSLSATKDLTSGNVLAGLAQHLDLERSALLSCASSIEIHDRLRAFLDKKTA